MTVVDSSRTGAIPLDSSVRRLWRIRALLVTVPVGLVIAAGIAAGVAAGLHPLVGASIAFAVLALPTALVFAVTNLAWSAWRFEVGDEVLVLRHGVWIRSESWVPYHRVQHIDLEAGPLERRLGLTSLVVRTASAATDGTVPGLHPDEAAGLRRTILDRAGRGDAV